MTTITATQLLFCEDTDAAGKNPKTVWSKIQGSKPSRYELVQGAGKLGLSSSSSWDTGIAKLVDGTIPAYVVTRPITPDLRAKERKEAVLQLERELHEERDRNDEMNEVLKQCRKTIQELGAERKIHKERAERDLAKLEVELGRKLYIAKYSVLESILKLLDQKLKAKINNPSVSHLSPQDRTDMTRLSINYIEHILQHRSEDLVRGQLCRKLLSHLTQDDQELAVQTFLLYTTMKEARNAAQHPNVNKDRAKSYINTLEWSDEIKMAAHAVINQNSKHDIKLFFPKGVDKTGIDDVESDIAFAQKCLRVYGGEE
ncbi:hypothetical protein BDQ17DRAFT_1354686 [Cyathus striatus]|nr:hypothetical protein BDQ17DRAFT_1354686 [Cyathus striatus]